MTRALSYAPGGMVYRTRTGGVALCHVNRCHRGHFLFSTDSSFWEIDSMTIFAISASEALFIGCAMGEYTEARQDNEFANVLHFFWHWLSPLVTNFEEQDSEPVSGDEIPNDLQWLELADRSIAVSRSHPEAIYTATDSVIVRTLWRRPRSSLLDLLYDLVSPHVKRSQQDSLRFWTPEERASNEFRMTFLRRTQDMWVPDDWSPEWHEARYSMESLLSTPVSPDDLDAVRNCVTELITANSMGGYFGAGRLFGRVTATVQRITAADIHDLGGDYCTQQELRNGRPMWRSRSYSELTRNYQARIREVLSNKLVQQSFYAVAILNSELSRVITADEGSPYLRPSGPQAHARVSLALGSLLGLLRDVDEESIRRDSRALVPRIYMLSSKASTEQIQGLLHLLEQTFSLGDARYQPEYVITCSANAIEALAKRLWPNEFDKDTRQGELRNVLRGHTDSQDEIERRFARTALTLYDVYRKPAVHAFGSFRCTWEEARFFYCGMRTLTELAESLLKKRTT